MTLESTKADDIAVVIEEAIVSGELAPGSVLRQEQLSERFGVSRTPVREALRRLAALGLVSFEPNKGVRVRTLSHDDLREAFLVRAELEALVTEIAARKWTPEAMAELEECEKRFARLTKEVRSHEPGGERRSLMSDWMRANHAFHDVIYRVADVPFIESVAKSARRTFSGPTVWAPVDDELERLYERNQAEHRAIRQALAAGSVAGAQGARARARHALVRAADDDPRARRRRLGANLSFTTRPELRGTFGAVASTHWLATQTGMAVLERGGNAFDAACAAGFVLQVVEPHLNGPGGDLPAVFWPAESGEAARPLRPGRLAGRRDDRGVPLARPCPRARHRCRGGVRARLVRRLAPAARAVRDLDARRGARVRDRLRRARLPGRRPGSRRRSSAPSRCCVSGPGLPSSTCRLPETGSTFRNPQLAATWRRLLDESDGTVESARRVYYEGFVAEEIDRFSRGAGRLPHRRGPGRVAGDDRAAGDRRLPRADGLQDGGVGAGPRCAPAAAPARGLRRRRRSARPSSCTS